MLFFFLLFIECGVAKTRLCTVSRNFILFIQITFIGVQTFESHLQNLPLYGRCARTLCDQSGALVSLCCVWRFLAFASRFAASAFSVISLFNSFCAFAMQQHIQHTKCNVMHALESFALYFLTFEWIKTGFS